MYIKIYIEKYIKVQNININEAIKRLEINISGIKNNVFV